VQAVNFTENDRIIPHINAAATMCHNRSFSNAHDALLRGLLFEIFTYIFTLTAFSHAQYLQLQLAMQVLASPFLSDGHYQGILLGRCRPIFGLILQIAMLDIPNGTAVRDETTKVKLELIEGKLISFEVSQVRHMCDARVDEDTVSELYRLACLIHVKKLLFLDAAPRIPGMQELLEDFISRLDELPANSPANGILCWPLVVAGMSAIATPHRRTITGRLRKNHETWRSDILSKSVDLLVRKWRDDALDGTMEMLKSKSKDEARCRPAWRSLQSVQYPLTLL
jgi:hypothetical protein